MNYNLDKHLLPIEGAHNVRDLGGYPTKNGYYTKEQLFFRSDTTNTMTLQDIQLLKSRGVTLVNDLRSEQEAQEKPSVFKNCPGVRYESIPLLDNIHSTFFKKEITDFPPMSELYINLLEDSGDGFARIFHLFAENNGASLFHCTAGKDRTGITAMLLLSLANVDDEIIIADYAATEVYMRPVQERILQQLEAAQIQVPVTLFSSDPVSMERTLGHLHAKYDDAWNYLMQNGVAEEELAGIRTRFIS